MREAGSLAVCGLCLLIAGTCAAQQPLASLEDEGELELFSPGNVTIERVREHATDGEWAMRVSFPGSDRDTWPGLSIRPEVDTTQYDVLAFDAFNPGDEDARLSWRLDPVDGGAEFGGTGVPAGESKRVEVWLSGYGPIERIYLYARMPRRDYVFIFDDFQWASVEERFIPMRYVDDARPPEPTEAERERAFILFGRPLTDMVFANAVPRADERIETVEALATPGEHEPATLSLYALEDLSELRVGFADVPATGEVLPVRCMDKRVTYNSDRYIAGMPVLCERRESVDVPAGTCRRVVIDLHVAADAAPGLHEGTVTIDAAGREAVTVPLRLRVLPYELAEPADVFRGEYYKGPQLADTEEGRLEELRRDLTDQRAHGMTSVGMTFGVPGEAYEWAGDGELTLNLDGTLYAHFMDLYVELGFPMPLILLSDSGQAAASGAGDFTFDSDEWAEHYMAFWRAMQAEHRRRGWPEVIVQPVDEPGWQSRERQLRNIRCLKLLNQIPGMRTEQDGPVDEYFVQEAGPWADVWNCNGGLPDPPVVERAQNAGKTMTVYNCDVESYRPEVDRYVAGWYQLAAGISGCFNWAYMSWRGSPYDDNDHATGTWMHVYPAMGDEPGGPSTGWIGRREGVDDYRYVHTLRLAIQRAEQAGGEAARLAREAREELAGIIDSIEYDPRVRGRCEWTTVETLDDGSMRIGGTLALPNGWTYADYAAMRRLVAGRTVELMAAMGEVEG